MIIPMVSWVVVSGGRLLQASNDQMTYRGLQQTTYSLSPVKKFFPRSSSFSVGSSFSSRRPSFEKSALSQSRESADLARASEMVEALRRISVENRGEERKSESTGRSQKTQIALE